MSKSETRILLRTNLKHDGVSHAARDTVVLPEAIAEALIADGDAEPVADKAPRATDTAPANAQNSDPAPDRASLLAAGIAALEPGNADHWTNAGKPEVRALAAATKLGDISAKERDLAWAAYQASRGPEGDESEDA
ncbi:hypothetical protein [Ruegeria atlantica]|uniref:hypothetical protein n=1 Tax=Ruegeria atlantica TaxID=81569 RepID=UPI00147A1191|nr:hypothetical protein [Ruegeria atlantica]